MTRAITMTLAALAVALAVGGTAHAAGGDYVLQGGTSQQRAQVRGALEASAFDWGLVKRQVTIRIGRGITTHSRPGGIWIDSRLLDAGVASWGIVQHEYAHQVDFLLLDSGIRGRLLRLLGGREWCWGAQAFAHHEYGCERFASTLAWAYWPSSANILKPKSKDDESAAMAPGRFRALMTELVGAPSSLAAKRTR